MFPLALVRLCPAKAPPIATLLKPVMSAPLAVFDPMKTLLTPLVISFPAKGPIVTLQLPLVMEHPDSVPKTTLHPPVVTPFLSAPSPIITFDPPVVILIPAELPNAMFFSPDVKQVNATAEREVQALHKLEKNLADKLTKIPKKKAKQG